MRGDGGNSVAVGSEVVDISIDPLDERRRRGRAWLRLGIPIGGVALMVAVILAIALYSERANRAGALALSEDLLTALDSRIALAVSSYLDPATRAVAVARDVVKEGSITARLPVIETFGASLLRQIPQIAILSFADEGGNYVMVRRGAAGEGRGGEHGAPGWFAWGCAAAPTHPADRPGCRGQVVAAQARA